MSVGVERRMYSFCLADARIWPDDTKIINCSLPGFTSADAAAFFFRHQELWVNGLGAVVIYLGNCDTASAEIKKGRYGYCKQVVNNLREVSGLITKKIKLKNKLLHYEWDNSWNPSIESPEDQSDFEFNIERVIKACLKRSIPVVLIRPKANRYFLPGIGKGNFVFYRFMNVKDKIAHHIRIPDDRFKDALSKNESGKINEAASGYKKILLNPSLKVMSQEYYFLVVNNYSIVQAELGNTSEAIYLLELLLKERGVRKEILLYNLAQIYKQLGNQQIYSELMTNSYESDESLYRIRSPYLDAIDNMASKYLGVRVLDMESVLADKYYLDHCHPLPDGQKKLSEKIINYLSEFGIRGNKTASIENILYNPELSRGNVLSFHDYFKTYSLLSEFEIVKGVEILSECLNDLGDIDRSSRNLASVPQAIIDSINYYLRHPCFSTVADVIKSPPRYPMDVGRFPEYFLIRYLIPYIRIHEGNELLVRRFSGDLGLLRSSQSLEEVLPKGADKFIDVNTSQIEMGDEELKLISILSKVSHLLSEHLIKKNQIFERTKTTIFWYVRESLRFGAHSRYSMLYDRLLLEFLAEGLAVAGVVDAGTGYKKANEIVVLINILESTIKTHEKYCAQFSLKNDTGNLLISYDNELIEVAQQLKDQVCTY
jgi:hypothetical protein